MSLVYVYMALVFTPFALAAYYGFRAERLHNKLPDPEWQPGEVVVALHPYRKYMLVYPIRSPIDGRVMSWRAKDDFNATHQIVPASYWKRVR